MKKSTHSSATISARKGKKPHGLNGTSLFLFGRDHLGGRRGAVPFESGSQGHKAINVI
jgi:hypothetical protein